MNLVKIYGDITLGDKIVIGANSVVNKSFSENNIVIAGAPAKKVGKEGKRYAISIQPRNSIRASKI